MLCIVAQEYYKVMQKHYQFFFTATLIFLKDGQALHLAITLDDFPF